MEANLQRKRVFLLLVTWIWVPLAVFGGTGNNNTANATAPLFPSSSSRPRVVNIGALFTANSVIGKSAEPALVAAINDVNSDSTILSGSKLNLIFQDTNCSGFVGTVDGKGFSPL